MRRSIVGLFLAAMLGVAGCGASTSGGTGPQGAGPGGGSGVAGATPGATEAVVGALSANSCSLLTQSEVATALGKASDAGSPPSGGGNSCVWSASDMSFSTVEVSVIDVQTFDDTANPGAMMTVKQVRGVGDSAYYLEAGSEVILNVRKGDLAFNVTILSPDITTARAESAEVPLAKAILGRI
jgi:hypothetical protein